MYVWAQHTELARKMSRSVRTSPGAIAITATMSSYAVALVECGSALHRADLECLRARYGAIPHHYSSWPIHSTIGWWRWCRVLTADGALVTGFAIHLTRSRALPGTHIGTVECLGRALHADLASSLGDVLRATSRHIPRLLRLDVRIFDEDVARRRELVASLSAAGLIPCVQPRQYSHTLWLELGSSEDALLRGFSNRVRSTIKKTLNSPVLHFGPIEGEQYEERIRHLYTLPFERTGGNPPPIDVKAILQDSVGGYNSSLVGAFMRDRKAPDDLVGLAWARLHGDYAVFEINASERSNSLSPGFGLMWRQLTWAMMRGARWMDLGGLPALSVPSDHPMHGIIEYKRRFCSNFCEVAEEWRLEPHPLLTSAASATRRLARLVWRTHDSPRPLA
jgi:hypothetical protein